MNKSNLRVAPTTCIMVTCPRCLYHL